MRVARVETAPAAPAPPAEAEGRPVVEANKAFERAFAEGRLLTPADQSAKHFVGVMNRSTSTTSSPRAPVRRCRWSSCRAPRSRSKRWTPRPPASGSTKPKRCSAPPMTACARRAPRSRQQIAMETAKPVPASALKLVTYVAPAYPPRASERIMEGWVDVEFTVGTNGNAQHRRDRGVARRIVPPRSDRGRRSGNSSRASSWGARSSRPPTRASASFCSAQVARGRAAGFLPLAAVARAAGFDITLIATTAERHHGLDSRQVSGRRLRRVAMRLSNIVVVLAACRLRHRARAVPLRLHERRRYVQRRGRRTRLVPRDHDESAAMRARRLLRRRPAVRFRRRRRLGSRELARADDESAHPRAELPSVPRHRRGAAPLRRTAAAAARRWPAAARATPASSR